MIGTGRTTIPDANTVTGKTRQKETSSTTAGWSETHSKISIALYSIELVHAGV